MIDGKTIVESATVEASGVAKNVLVLARALKLTPKQLADAIADSESNANYYADFVASLTKTRMAEALENDKATD